MKREPRLTKRERKERFGKGTLPPTQTAQDANGSDAIAPTPSDPNAHLHCVACGAHLDTVGAAKDRAKKGLSNNLWMAIRCAHGSEWAACMGCVEKAQAILDEHDRTGTPVRPATPWH